MSTKLIRLDVPETLHRRIKTLAAYYEKKIPDYILEILEQHVPKGISFSESDDGEKKKRLPS